MTIHVYVQYPRETKCLYLETVELTERSKEVIVFPKENNTHEKNACLGRFSQHYFEAFHNVTFIVNKLD